MLVQCCYRVHPQGEIMSGRFDLESGVVVECPELVKVNVSNIYEYMPQCYIDFSPISKEDIVCQMLYFKEALVVMDYNSIGYLVVEPRRVVKHLISEATIDKAWGMQDTCCQMRSVCIGVLKTKVLTYKSCPYIAKLYMSYNKEHPKGVIYTSDGELQLSSSIKPDVFIDNSYPDWLWFIKDIDAYAFFFKGADAVRLYKSGNVLYLKGEV